MTKKFFAVIIFLFLFAPCVCAFELPQKINNWVAVNENVLNLNASTENQNLGRVIYKNYIRRRPRGELQIILTEGDGPGALYVPENNIKNSDSDSLFASGSDYEVLNILGYRAILELNENLPPSLAVRVNQDTTLTIESYSLNKNEIINLAKEILRK